MYKTTTETAKFATPCDPTPSDYPCEHCGQYGTCKWTKEQPRQEPYRGMSVDEANAYLAERARDGVFGLTWAQLENKLGGKISRPK